ncbi:MAG: inositol monophosphatase [Sphingomonas fennica]
MTGDPLTRAVAALMRQVAAEVMLPRYRNLHAGEVSEKAPGDLVTVVDRESERRLTEGLLAIEPGTRVIGEEAVAADPALMDGIGEGAVWIVDPLDGTSNYAAGEGAFAIMIALADAGEVRGGWILDPVTDRLCHATRGGGAFVDGERIAARATGRRPPIGALANQWLSAPQRARLDPVIDGRFTLADVPRCAGEQYPRVGLGENDVALYWRALPWDHAPGALWLNEAGGRLARLDGRPYLIAQDEPGLLAAATPALWDEAAGIIGPGLMA